PADPEDGASPGGVTPGAADGGSVPPTSACAPADALGGASAVLAVASNDADAFGGESKSMSYSSGSCGADASTTALSSRTRTPALRNSRSSCRYSPIVRWANPAPAGCVSIPTPADCSSA